MFVKRIVRLRQVISYAQMLLFLFPKCNLKHIIGQCGNKVKKKKTYECTIKKPQIILGRLGFQLHCKNLPVL